MKPQIRYHWDQLSPIDLEAFHEMKIQIHLALHNVALVGHHYSMPKLALFLMRSIGSLDYGELLALG